MAPLPPVRKRASYAGIKADDLTMALFHDRVMQTEAMRPYAEDLMQNLEAAPAATGKAVREKMLLDADVLALLNKQITRERYAEAAYTAIATWADANAFPGLQAWAEASAAEEREHAIKQIAYLNDRARVTLEPLPAPDAEFDGYAGALGLALALEQIVSRALTTITAAARAQGDEATALFIGGFLAEQVTAEKELTTYLQRVARGAPIDLLDAELFEGAG